MRRAQPIGRLRLYLTAWYAATLCVVLLLLGGALYFTIRHQFATELDESLHDATRELMRAARIREQEAGVRGPVVDAVDELHVPGRTLYLLATDGRPVKPDTAAPWIRAAAVAAARVGQAEAHTHIHGVGELRLHAERFALASGTGMVAAAVADEIELEDRYASLITAFAIAAGLALLLVSAAGWILVRKSTVPIEDMVGHMRRFMADAAHELRTPLTVLRTRAEIALERPRTVTEYSAALHAIETESERLGHIVDDLLMLARADAGERPIARVRVFLDDVVLDATHTALIMAHAKGVDLQVDGFEEAVVEGDPVLLRQLAMILLDNAIKFSAAGERVGVRVGMMDGIATVAVQDTGIGIAVEHLPHVFDRFYRGDSARSRGAGASTDGAGLGLSIARWIAAEHGASINISSEPGRGTCVTVRFPAVAAPTTP